MKIYDILCILMLEMLFIGLYYKFSTIIIIHENNIN